MGDKGIVEALERLDRITGEELRTVVAQTHVDVSQMLTHQGAKQQEESLERCWEWLSPPDVSINHGFACSFHHARTGRWFLEGGAFTGWKSEGSLLWIHGKPGSGKTILCSAIIEDLLHLRAMEEPTFMVAYFYCSFQDSAKQTLRGLLSSTLIQLCSQSYICRDLVLGSYLKHDKGTKRPTDESLAQCLSEVLVRSGSKSMFLILDALDECPTSGTSSSRRQVLQFIREIVSSRYPGLRVCVTSRPEEDIGNALKTLASKLTRSRIISGRQSRITRRRRTGVKLLRTRSLTLL
ncbi:hypothetical protein BC834DRAFT_578380 [Gloeopeniophorella convolvens]|nr:hypothetical protein BC834DRAFT_578380 [Gloeopeniophorella convolvens]